MSGVQENELWVLAKRDLEECGTLLAACIGLVLLLAALLHPFTPSLTTKVILATCLYEFACHKPCMVFTLSVLTPGLSLF